MARLIAEGLGYGTEREDTDLDWDEEMMAVAEEPLWVLLFFIIIAVNIELN